MNREQPLAGSTGAGRGFWGKAPARLPALVAVAALVACANTPPHPAPVVRVPVPMPCLADPPAKLELVTDAELRAMNDYQLVLALWRFRLLALGYIGELEAAVDACSRIAVAPAAGR